MRIGVGDEFLRTTGGTLTGPLTISANAAELLLLNRPDGAAHSPIASQRAGVTDYLLRNLAAEPFLALADAAAASRLTLNMATGAIGVATITPAQAAALALTGGTLSGALTISANAVALLTLDRPDDAVHNAIDFLGGGVSHFRLRHNALQPRIVFTDAGGASRLSIDDTTGLLGTGLIPLSMLRVDEQTAGNAAPVTVTAATVTIASLASMTVAIGDRILVMARARYDKGATAGNSQFAVAKTAGTATVIAEKDWSTSEVEDNMLANSNHYYRVATLLAVTGAGTLTLSMRGFSLGSDSAVAANLGNIRALVLRG